MTPDEADDRTVTLTELPDIPWERIDTVYRGRPGCMCGCRGDYAATAESAPFQAQERGYPVAEWDRPRERAVRGRLGAMLTAAEEGLPIEVQDAYIYSVDVGDTDAYGRDRTVRYALYLRNKTEEDRAANREILRNALERGARTVHFGIAGPG